MGGGGIRGGGDLMDGAVEVEWRKGASVETLIGALLSRGKTRRLERKPSEEAA